MVSLLHSCWVETVYLYALLSPGFVLLLLVCRLEEMSLETLQGVGGIVKAMSELSFSFKPSLLAHSCSFSPSPLPDQPDRALPAFPG